MGQRRFWPIFCPLFLPFFLFFFNFNLFIILFFFSIINATLDGRSLARLGCPHPRGHGRRRPHQHLPLEPSQPGILPRRDGRSTAGRLARVAPMRGRPPTFWWW